MQMRFAHLLPYNHSICLEFTFGIEICEVSAHCVSFKLHRSVVCKLQVLADLAKMRYIHESVVDTTSPIRVF